MATWPKWDNAKRHSLERNINSVTCILQAYEVYTLDNRDLTNAAICWKRWKSVRKWHRGRTERSQLSQRRRDVEKERTAGKRAKAWGASMSLQMPWTHVRDPLLLSVRWSVAGAMSSQPGKSLHGSQPKSPHCSKLRYVAMFPPLPHVSKQLTILCPCLHGVTLDISSSGCGHVYKHGKMSLLGEVPPLIPIPRAPHVWVLCFRQICLNMKHCALLYLYRLVKSNVSGSFVLL